LQNLARGIEPFKDPQEAVKDKETSHYYSDDFRIALHYNFNKKFACKATPCEANNKYFVYNQFMIKKKQIIDSGKGSIVIYHDKSGKAELEVKLEKDTVWLSQAQIAELFAIERSVITKHLNNVFKSGELVEKSNVQNLHIARSDKPVKFYNLDIVLSVGYRINSIRATQFRIWATKILRSYLIKGFAVNQRRLLEQNERFNELKQAVAFITEKSERPQLEGQAKELLNIVNEYTKSLTLLYQYDQKGLKLHKGQKPKFILGYDEAILLIKEIREKLAEKKEASSLFGQEYGYKFKAILGAVYQTFGGKQLYASVDEKAANLLYLIIKDHPFADGNKRISSILFLYFLEKNNYLFNENGLRKINDNTMVALALLIAENSPSEKEVMIKIVTNLLK
jgi:prophage maintenance system killer protein